MAHRSLQAPWRIDYIRSLHQPDSRRCFLCDAAGSGPSGPDEAALVLWRTEHSVVLMNRFPYTNGHLLIAPRTHCADLEELSAEQKLDIMEQASQAVLLLKRAVAAQGFNVGFNLGRCAGAGVPGHLHQHVVPRWAGDVNFMSVVGEVQVVPQAISQLFDELGRVRRTMMAT